VDREEVPQDAKILPSKFVLKVKRLADGTIDRFKARLVVLGNLQQSGIDYETTFSPVVDFTVVRMMLAIAAKKGCKVHQMDVKTAFLNGDLDVDVYLQLPKEFQRMYGSGKVFHLRRSLYGLRPAPRIWYETLWADLIAKGFEVSKSCPCVFQMNGKKLYLLIYVDDSG
jgi:Reverse transcriptase (RNA-dependent DNA polymerase)